MTFWAVEWHDHSRLDGRRRYLIWDKDVRLFRTRKECRAFVDKRYGYIRERPDLRAEPHGWLTPRAVQVAVSRLTARGQTRAAERVVAAARRHSSHDSSEMLGPCTCGANAVQDALAAYDAQHSVVASP